MELGEAIAVVKIGGSMLSLPGIAQRLEAFLCRLCDEGRRRPLIVVGGGAAAELVRAWQRMHGLTDEQAHWSAVRAMSLNEALLSHLLPTAAAAGTREEVRAAWTAGRVPILACEVFLRAEASQTAEPLPHDWSVTSDSIAAWTARRLGAERLILLKSCDLPQGYDLHALARRGLVDTHFPLCIRELPVYWVNLRADPPGICQSRIR